MIQKTFAVTGGSRSYGAEIVNGLRNQDHIVYDIQRHIRPLVDEVFNPQTELEHFVSCDFSEAHDIVSAANWLYQKNLTLSGMVHAVGHCEDMDPVLLSTYDLEKHFTTNVFGPLLLTTYLFHVGCLVPGSRVIFLLDSRKLPHENTAYMIAKRSTVAIVEATRHLCEGVDFLYVAMPDRNSPKADDADEEVVRILTEEKLPKDKVTILKG